MLLGLAPVVTVVAQTSLGLVPILGLTTATVSLELKTPLTVILGTLGTLSRRGTALDPAERREFVEMAVRQGTRLKELIEQLLLAARFEQTSAEPAERPLVDAAAVARDVLAAARGPSGAGAGAGRPRRPAGPGRPR